MSHLWIFLFYCLVGFQAYAVEQTLEVGPWGIRLEAGEHTIMEGPTRKQTIKHYRGKQAPLLWRTDNVGQQTNDSVRRLAAKWQTLKGSKKIEVLSDGRKLYRFENKTLILWLLTSGEILTLDKKYLSTATAKFDIQRVRVLISP